MKNLKEKILIVLISLLCIPASAIAFSDIPAQSQFYEDAQYLENQGIATEEVFMPSQTISKKDFIRWLLLDENFKEENYQIRTKERFIDVPIKSAYSKYIYYLADNGVIKIPHAGRFYPDRPIRRLEALRFTFFIKGIPVPKVFPEQNFPFQNLTSKSYFAHELYKGFTLGMITDNAYVPYGPLTRIEAARFLRASDEGSAAGTLTVIQISSDGLSQTRSQIVKNEKFSLFETAWENIKNKYINKEDLSDEDLLYGATEGLVKELGDQHSEFSRPTDNTLSESLSGQIEGIGAVIEADEDKQIVIVSPVKGSPAEKAGLLSLDIILEVNGEPITGIGVNKAAMKIRGEAGTSVTLKIRRDKKDFSVTIVRSKISVSSVTISFTNDNIAILTLSSFSQNTSGEFLKAVAEIAETKPRGIILDLRNNPGGFLDTSVFIAGFFIGKGKTVAKVKYPEKTEIELSSGTGVLAKYPVYVLVNKGSASASEILAGALQDHGIGTIIGEKTYGKGTVQEFTTFSDGSSLKITVAQWLTPLNRLIEEQGIQPDVSIERTADDIRSGKDPQLDRALFELRK